VVSRVGERVIRVISEPFFLSGHEVVVTASVGTTLFPDDSREVEGLLRDADLAMYQAKEGGGNGLRRFTAAVADVARSRFSLEEDLRRAIVNNEFEMVYQPKVEARTWALVGAEAFLRWNHRQRGRISPAEFLDVAEEANLMRPIGHWVLETVARQMRSWLDQGVDFGRIAVNLTARELAQPDLADRVQQIFAAAGVPLHHLELEVTEGGVLRNIDAAVAVMQRLAEMGVGITLDDFGTGYSSLTYLRRLPISTIKIDRSFVARMLVEPADQAIVKLRRSHRFGANSGIGRLAQAVNTGQAALARQLLAQALPDLALVALDARGQALSAVALESASGWRHTFAVLRQQRPSAGAAQGDHDAWAQQVLKAAGRFQVLCAVRGGPQGVEAVNRRIAQALAAEGLIPSAEGWFLGRPVMVTRNDYALGLMNGDVGVTLHGPAAGSSEPPLRVAFPDGLGGIRWVLPSRLQDVETVFAMTVHKSQGSEFDHVALVLPGHMSAVVTRELLYTAITRARVRFTLVAPEGRMDVLQQAVQRTAPRAASAGASTDVPGLQVA
jgi:EAL domain-containing protein (putative c-di-GMP-specific phosphodiesterase class I)